MRKLILATTASILAALALAGWGCQTTTVGPGGMVAMPSQFQPSQPVPIAGAIREARSPNSLSGPKVKETDPDPCATRLEDLVTPLYEYYVRFHRLPDKLEDVSAVADITTVLNFNCPASGRPYIYNPVGLQAQAGDILHLILYDATPAHHGRRWGVVAGPTPNRQGQVFYQMDVVQLTEEVFKSFKQVPAPETRPAAEMPAEPPVPDQGAGTPPGQQ